MSAPKTAPPATPWLDGLLGAAAAAALVLTPLFFNPRTDRVFEPDKLAWVIALGLLCAAALLVRTVERPRGHRWPSALRGAPALAVLATLAVLAGSTMLSVAPATALWGSYRRGLGLIAWGALALLFAATAVSATTPSARDRLRRAMLLPAVPAGIYALLQRFGIDTIPWSQYGASAELRAFASLGNAIFLGAWLAMVAPVAATGLAAAWSARSEGRVGATRHVVGHALVLLLAVSGLLASGSRGPVLGLLAGLGALVLWHVAAMGRPRLLGAVLAAAAGAPIALIGLGRAGVPGLSRFGDLLSAGSRTARERLLAWDALVDAALADPVRAIIGHGLETVPLFLPPFADAELTRLTPTQIFDRSHDVAWEWWVAAGLIGVAVWLLLQLAAFGAGYRVLGWIEDRGDAKSMVLAGLGAGTIGALLAAIVAGPGAVGAGLTVGLAAGLVSWGAWRAHRLATSTGAGRDGPASAGTRGRSAMGPDALLAAGLMAALASHLVEGALGLPTAPAEVVAWVALGLLAALAVGARTPGDASSAGPASARSSRKRRVKEPASERPLSFGPALAEGLITGLALAAVFFAPILLPFGSSALFDGAKMLVLLLPAGLWLVDDLLSPEGGVAARAIGRLAPPIALLILLLPLRSVVGGPAAAFGLVLLGSLLAAALARGRGSAPAELWRFVPYATVGLLSMLAIWLLAWRPIHADAQLRAGLEAAVRGESEASLERYRRATELWPSQAAYRGYVAGWHRERMVSDTGTPLERQEAFALALEELEVAESLWPVASSARRLGVLHRDLGDVAPDPESRAIGWGEALEHLDRALARDPHGVEALVERGRVLERLERYEEAAADHGRAADLDPGRAEAWTGWARALLAADDLTGGIAVIDASLAALDDQRVLDMAGAPLPAPWVRQLGPPIDALARGALLVIARARVEGPEEGRAALAQLIEIDPAAPIVVGLGEWFDAGAPPTSPSDAVAPGDGE